MTEAELREEVEQDLTYRYSSPATLVASLMSDAQEMIDLLGLTFPVGYGLNYMTFAEQTGAFYEERRGIIHATDFILRSSGEVVSAVYSTNPIGRYWPEDCTRLLDFLMKQ